ncbi:MAG: hypothetical protein ABI597_09710 [Gammaproteobacteria bacterium]
MKKLFAILNAIDLETLRQANLNHEVLPADVQKEIFKMVAQFQRELVVVSEKYSDGGDKQKRVNNCLLELATKCFLDCNEINKEKIQLLRGIFYKLVEQEFMQLQQNELINALNNIDTNSLTLRALNEGRDLDKFINEINQIRDVLTSRVNQYSESSWKHILNLSMAAQLKELLRMDDQLDDEMSQKIDSLDELQELSALENDGDIQAQDAAEIAAAEQKETKIRQWEDAALLADELTVSLDQVRVDGPKVVLVRDEIQHIIDALRHALNANPPNIDSALLSFAQLGEFLETKYPRVDMENVFNSLATKILDYKDLQFIDSDFRSSLVNCARVIKTLREIKVTPDTEEDKKTYSTLRPSIENGVKCFMKLLGSDRVNQALADEANADTTALRAEATRFLKQDLIPNTPVRKQIEAHAESIKQQGRLHTATAVRSACFTIADKIRETSDAIFSNPQKTQADVEKLAHLKNDQAIAACYEKLKQHRSHKVFRVLRKIFLGVGVVALGIVIPVAAKMIYSKVTTGSFSLFSDRTKSYGKVRKAEQDIEERAVKRIKLTP